MAGDELAVGAVGEEVAGAEIEGNFGRRDFDLSDAANECRGLFELKELQVAFRRALFPDAAKCFNSRFHDFNSSSMVWWPVADRATTRACRAVW